MRFALAVLAIVSFAANAHAEAHDGLYLRGQVGLGWASASTELADTAETDLSFKGGAGYLNLEVGGAIKAPLIIFGKLYHLRARYPKLAVGTLSFDSNIDAYISGIGGGATYYFMPSNFYLTGAISFGIMGAKDNRGNDFDTDVGLMTHLGFGIEFLTGPNFGLGVGAELALGFFTDEIATDDLFWGAGYGLITLNATYN